MDVPFRTCVPFSKYVNASLGLVFSLARYTAQYTTTSLTGPNEWGYPACTLIKTRASHLTTTGGTVHEYADW